MDRDACPRIYYASFERQVQFIGKISVSITSFSSDLPLYIYNSLSL